MAGTQLDCQGIVSGTNINSFSVIDGSDTGNSVGDVVEMLPTAAWGQDLADALMVGHTRAGAHAASLPLTSPVLTTPVIADYTTATHTHATTAQGGQLSGSAIATGSQLADRLLNPYKFSVYLASSQTVSANTWVQATLDTKAFDTGSNYNTSTHQFTAPIAGFYCFIGTLVASGIADTGAYAMGINVGTFSVTPTYTLAQVAAGANTATVTASGSVIVSLTAGQTVQLDGFTGSTVFVGGAGQTTFSGFLMSAT